MAWLSDASGGSGNGQSSSHGQYTVPTQSSHNVYGYNPNIDPNLMNPSNLIHSGQYTAQNYGSYGQYPPAPTATAPTAMGSTPASMAMGPGPVPPPLPTSNAITSPLVPPERTYSPARWGIVRPSTRDAIASRWRQEEENFVLWANIRWPGDSAEIRGKRAVALEEYMVYLGMAGLVPQRSSQTIQERVHYRGGHIKNKEQYQEEKWTKKRAGYERFFQEQGSPPPMFSEPLVLPPSQSSN